MAVEGPGSEGDWGEWESGELLGRLAGLGTRACPDLEPGWMDGEGRTSEGKDPFLPIWRLGICRGRGLQTPHYLPGHAK